MIFKLAIFKLANHEREEYARFPETSCRAFIMIGLVRQPDKGVFSVCMVVGLVDLSTVSRSVIGRLSATERTNWI